VRGKRETIWYMFYRQECTKEQRWLLHGHPAGCYSFSVLLRTVPLVWVPRGNPQFHANFTSPASRWTYHRYIQNHTLSLYSDMSSCGDLRITFVSVMLNDLCMVLCGLHILVEEHTTPPFSRILGSTVRKRETYQQNTEGQSAAVSFVERKRERVYHVC
jgi:hypothetical protein